MSLALATLADRLPASLQTARWDPPRRAVLGGLAVVVAVAAVLGVRLAVASAAARPVAVPSHARPSPSSVAAHASGGAASPSTAVPTPTGSPSGRPTGTSAAAAELVVYVSGRVRHPGVLSLAAGSRIQDALRAAGGALPGSDLVGINLAQPLTDGEQILVAGVGRGSSISAGGPGSSGAAGSSGGTPGSQVVDLNSGDVSAFDSLPGVGPVLAQRIVDWRTQHGRFSSVDELDEVSGIGAKLLDQIRPRVRV